MTVEDCWRGANFDLDQGGFELTDPLKNKEKFQICKKIQECLGQGSSHGPIGYKSKALPLRYKVLVNTKEILDDLFIAAYYKQQNPAFLHCYRLYKKIALQMFQKKFEKHFL